MRPTVWIVGVALACAGCVTPDLVDCSDGTSCPASTICDPVHHTCDTHEQLAACDGLGEFAACDTGTLVGRCFGGVCLSSGCGNGIEEPDEVCDDGNVDDGDGCSHDCQSIETCGNGIVDEGETCDDENLVSHDGCSSACETEMRSWTLDAIGPATPDRENAVYDPLNGRVVEFEWPLTYEWDGQTWALMAREFPADGATPVLAWDAKNKQVVALGDKLLWKWDGHTWTVKATVGAAPNITSATFDKKAGVFFVVGHDATNTNVAAFTLDPDNPMWTAVSLPVNPMSSTDDAIAMFDDVEMNVMFMVMGTSPKVYRRVLGIWVASPPPVGGASTGSCIVFDPAKKLISVFAGEKPTGYSTDGFDFDFKTATWTKWTVPLAIGRSHCAAWGTSSDVYALGGLLSPTRQDDALVRLSTQENLAPPVPRGLLSAAALPAESAVLVLTTTDMWKWTDHWTRVASVPAQMTSATWDPNRGGVLAIDSTTLTWLYKDGSWMSLGIHACSAVSLTYDYAGQRAIAASGGVSCYLSSAEPAAWSNLGAVVASVSGFVGYDSIARRPVLLLDAPTASGLYDLLPPVPPTPNPTWTTSLSPGPGYRVLSNVDYGSLILVPVQNNTLPVWQRRTETWHDLGPPILLPDGIGATIRGRNVIFARQGHAVMHLGFGAGDVDESCTPTEDTDQDQAIGCADRDCWATCTPVCPPVDPSCNPL